jgi:hypothetical protein
MGPNRKVEAQVIRLGKKGGVTSWKVKVEYDGDDYLVLITGEAVTVYLERELPESRGIAMSWPTHMTGIRAAGIECCRRVRFGLAD